MRPAVTQVDPQQDDERERVDGSRLDDGGHDGLEGGFGLSELAGGVVDGPDAVGDKTCRKGVCGESAVGPVSQKLFG